MAYSDVDRQFELESDPVGAELGDSVASGENALEESRKVVKAKQVLPGICDVIGSMFADEVHS